MTTGRKSKISKEIDEKLISTHNEKRISVIDLAKQFNIGTKHIYTLFRKNNIKLEKFNANKIRKKFKHLDITTKENICNDYINGMMVKDIAIKYDIGLSTVNNVRKAFNIEQNDLRTKINEDFFEIIDTAEKAWTLGFITGDGYMCNVDYKCVIDLAEKDIEILEKIKLYTESEHKIYKWDVLDKRTTNIYKHVVLVLSRKKMYEDLEKLGITNKKSSSLDIPIIQENLMKDYIRGLFCSDGWFHIDDKNTICFGICSSVQGFLEKIQTFLEKKCNLNKVKISFDSGNYRLIYNGNINVRKIFNYLYSEYYDENFPCLERKYKYAKLHFEKLDNNLKSRNIGGDLVSLI